MSTALTRLWLIAIVALLGLMILTTVGYDAINYGRIRNSCSEPGLSHQFNSTSEMARGKNWNQNWNQGLDLRFDQVRNAVNCERSTVSREQ